MKYVFDIDGTLCTTDESHDYAAALPYLDAVDEVNRLYDAGNHITLFTARGTSSGKDWHDLTLKQLIRWGVRYHELIDKGKPSWDLFVDDKAISANDWRKTYQKRRVGFVASCFDLLHAGHCLMLQDAKRQCDWLIVGLQSDPSIDRPEKNKPILSLYERFILLHANKFVDQVIMYNTEQELESVIKMVSPDVRILGSDYKFENKKIVGLQYCKEVYYHDRSHGMSTTRLRERIKAAIK
jgi:glycerol-3-phosphate cytidylyltransferase